jgi:hypothetical protein
MRFVLAATAAAAAAAALSVSACGGPARDAGAPDGGAGSDSSVAPPTGLCVATHACTGDPSVRPYRRSEFAFAYDETRHQLVVQGGSTAVSMMCNFPAPEFSDETWIYDDECGTWRLLAGAGPGPRARHMAAYDPAGDRVLVFGGRYGTGGTYTLYADLWALDLASETWSLLAPQDPAGPAPRTSGALAFDDAGGRLWLFGGNDSASGAVYGPLQDTWYFDVAAGAWVLVSAGPPDAAPAARLLVASAFDQSRGRFLVYGGTDDSAFSTTPIDYDDLWAFDTTAGQWIEMPPGAMAPSGRFFSAMAYDATSTGYLVFAGHDDTMLGYTNDLWRYDPDGGGWALLRLGDRYNAPATGFCMFPVDFTTPDFGAPDRRSSHALVASASCGHAVVFGGKTDCGAIDDTWAFDYASTTWINTVDATEGESCWRRWDGDFTLCNGLCF